MGDTGLSAMIRSAAQLELDFPGMEVLSLGRSATSDAEAELELGGPHLLYMVRLRHDEVRLAVALMDGIDPPQTLLRSPDTQAGWDVVTRLIHAMEQHEIASLQRPIEVGNPIVDDPRNCWVIS